MKVRNFSFSAGPVSGEAWTYFFDIDRGASVNIDGNTAGVIPSQEFETMVKQAQAGRDFRASAERIVEALENSTALPAGRNAFPDREPVIEAVADWLRS